MQKKTLKLIDEVLMPFIAKYSMRAPQILIEYMSIDSEDCFFIRLKINYLFENETKQLQESLNAVGYEIQSYDPFDKESIKVIISHEEKKENE